MLKSEKYKDYRRISEYPKTHNVSNGEIVKVEVNSPERKLIFDDVVIRVSNSYALAMHIDTDEANACVGAKEAKILK